MNTKREAGFAAALLLVLSLEKIQRGDHSHSHHHHVLHFIFTEEKETSVHYRLLDAISGSAWQEPGDNCDGGFGMGSPPVSRLNLLQMLFSRRHAGSKLQTCNSAQTSFHCETGDFSIASATLTKHPCSLLYSAPSLWFYSTPKFAVCLRFLQGKEQLHIRCLASKAP